MKVVVDGTQTYYLGWKYDNPLLDLMLEKVGITPEKAREMKVPAIADAIGINMHALPKPSRTHCIILNDERVKILDVTIKRYHLEEYNLDKARVYSMEKAIWALFPKRLLVGNETSELIEKLKQEDKRNKRIRGAFWNAYRTRNQKKENNVTKNIPEVVQVNHNGQNTRMADIC